MPKALQNYYKGIHFAKNRKALYDDLAVLTISKHTNFLSYYDRHKYLYKADASLKNPENVVLVYTGEERIGRNIRVVAIIMNLKLSTPNIFFLNQNTVKEMLKVICTT